MYMKSSIEDYDYVDVEGEVQPGDELSGPPFKMRRTRGRPRKKTAATLEEG